MSPAITSKKEAKEYLLEYKNKRLIISNNKVKTELQIFESDTRPAIATQQPIFYKHHY
jgi:hypothetical protein